MKKVYKDKIVNIENTDIFDNIFLFEFAKNIKQTSDVEIVFMSDLLEKRKNSELLEKVEKKPAIYSNVYSPKDEFEIFEELFNNAIKNKKKIHIVWISLKEEIELLEKYYFELGFFIEETNTFDVDFWVPLVSVWVKIENLMWKWSDYKRLWEKIFFNPPIRESWQVKAMFKWINRWVVAWVYIWETSREKLDFLWDCVKNEHILAITLAKVLSFNYSKLGFQLDKWDLEVFY